MKKIISVVGARPNFMKVAPLHHSFQKYKDKITHLICHTGQHYDEKMSKVFFEELGLPKPDFYLGVGGGSHAFQTASVMIEFEKICKAENPDLIIVVGDVNSTLACSLVASKLMIPIAHVEAGLRSNDRSMPEEINRIVTDVLADYLFVTEPAGTENLIKEGIPENKIYFTGNVMIDNQIIQMPKIKASRILETLNLRAGRYVLVTFHRPSNVDDPDSLHRLIAFLNRLAQHRQVVFPVHPRTMQNITENQLLTDTSPDLLICEPLGYLDFQKLILDAELIITDSGGIQEESTVLGVQCITVRNNTERPVTVTCGTNQLAGTDLNKVEQIALDLLHGKVKTGNIPDLWDGKAADRIVNILVRSIQKRTL